MLLSIFTRCHQAHAKARLVATSPHKCKLFDSTLQKMGTPVVKLQPNLIRKGDTITVVTRTTRYLLKPKRDGEFYLTSNNPARESGTVEVVGAMNIKDGTIEEGILETGKYMVFRHSKESDAGVKTSLVLRIEIEGGA